MNGMDNQRSLFTSESVTEGHPDKMCDQISDAILDAYYKEDPFSRVACETMVTTGVVVVAGEITSRAKVDIPQVVRQTIKEIGYDNADYGLDYKSCAIFTSIDEQSADISQGVSEAYELRNGNGNGAAKADKHGGAAKNGEIENTGAGDQGLMFGFAVNETEELMPLPIALAHRVVQRLTQVRKEGIIPYLRPDGKSQVTVEYDGNEPVRIDAVVVSAQHHPDVDSKQIQEDLTREVITPVVPAHLLDDKTKYFINPTGRFVTGGPHGDAGLTGRKIIVDTYGGMGRHGGGAFSGKDPTKVDRSAAYAARYMAKNVVGAGLAERCEIQLAYAIGVAQPVSVRVESYGTGRIPDHRIAELVRDHFDFRPGALIAQFNLRRPMYRPLAAYGQFGRPDLDLPWEATNLVDALRAAAGVTVGARGA